VRRQEHEARVVGEDLGEEAAQQREVAVDAPLPLLGAAPERWRVEDDPVVPLTSPRGASNVREGIIDLKREDASIGAGRHLRSIQSTA